MKMETEIKESEEQEKNEKEDLIVEDLEAIHDTQEKIEEEKHEYLYVYGVINNKDNTKNLKLRVKGLKDKPIEKVDFKDISALTSIYPTLKAALKEDEAMQHAEVLKKIAKKTTVVPMSFGTIFNDEEILETILSKSYLAIKQTLALIDGKFELGVKVVKNQLDNVPNGTAQEILVPLDKLSVKSVKGDNFSDRLLLNHSFLVEKNKFSKFSKEIAKLEKKHKDLKFIYTGPWPPYSFVNIRITGG